MGVSQCSHGNSHRERTSMRFGGGQGMEAIVSYNAGHGNYAESDLAVLGAKWQLPEQDIGQSQQSPYLPRW